MGQIWPRVDLPDTDIDFINYVAEKYSRDEQADTT